MVILIAAAAFCATFLGGLLALYLKDQLHLILGFSAGAVIGVAFFDLMPEALELAGKDHELAFVTWLIALGFVLYLVLDRLVILPRHHEDASHKHVHSEMGLLGGPAPSLPIIFF